MRHLIQNLLPLLLLTGLLASCGGGGGSSTPTPPPSSDNSPAPVPAPTPDPNPFNISDQEAFRFLRQATFGPVEGDVARVQQLGYEAWIDEQLTIPTSLQLPYMDSLPEPDDLFEGQTNRIDAWFRNVITRNDQLRQRMAFALSQIMVVSQNSVLVRTPRGLADYYDLLSRRAFGNFRDLMQSVTLHPAMGVYLSMLGNEKPNEALNIRPDENFARELMQLFTIGLVELNTDGTLKTDNNGDPIPTYNQTLIESFAHVYTGWTYANSASFQDPSFIFTQPMQAYPDFHDTGEKVLFDGVTLPAGQTAEEDLDDALDLIVDHPNVAPFISRRLIQRFVTANPSPEYIARVSSVFNDDGQAVRGNLFAVVKAILLDPEARNEPSGELSGKLTEPLLRLTALWRAYNASAANNRYLFAVPEFFFAQAPLRTPSVFSFFIPDFAPVGEIKTLGLVSPEMQITNETTVVSTNNYLAFAIYLRNSSTPDLDEEAIFINIDSDLALASDAAALVNLTADRLLGGAISQNLREQAIAMVNSLPESTPEFRVSEAIHTIVTSPEFAVLK